MIGFCPFIVCHVAAVNRRLDNLRKMARGLALVTINSSYLRKSGDYLKRVFLS